jgi:hypothetical protein
MISSRGIMGSAPANDNARTQLKADLALQPEDEFLRFAAVAILTTG